ncbi:MAG: LysE family transporter [bacterium]|nr:LysE family transporter [bacterium]
MVLEISSIFFSSFIIAFSGAIMPGPLLTVAVSESTRRGFKVGPLLILGHGILELLLVLLIIFGLAPFFKKPSVYIIIAIAGSVILMWMAWGMLKSLPKLTLDLKNSSEQKKNRLILSGLFLSLINPYWIIWWVTIGMGYILHSLEIGVLGIIFFFIGHILADLAWYSFISFSVSKGSSYINDKTYKCIIGFCAIFLVFFSIMFGYSGIKKLFKSQIQPVLSAPSAYPYSGSQNKRYTRKSAPADFYNFPDLP